MAQVETCDQADDCCSGKCLAMAPGVPFCQKLSACKVDGEVCNMPPDCCSGTCTLGSDGARRCQSLAGCSPANERCAVDAMPASPSPLV